jgi:hypothetical protein
MESYLLEADQIRSSIQKPEAGMGYQTAEVDRREGYIVASKVFVPITASLRGQLPDKVYHAKNLAVVAPQPKSTLTGRIIFKRPWMEVFGSPTSSEGRLENETTTAANDVFFRLSAYPDDNRIRSDRSLAPGSYSTTERDLTVVPSGLAAVGRFALPTRISARYVFKIAPGAGVRILYGTVIPDFGLCGGGVEVFFPEGTDPGTVSDAKKIPEK